MNSKRIRFSFLTLAVYAVLGVIGVYSPTPNAAHKAVAAVEDIAAIATSMEPGHSSSDGVADGEWQSFLPGAFK